MSRKDVIALGASAFIVVSIVVMLWGPDSAMPYVAFPVILAGGIFRIWLKLRSIATTDERSQGPAPDPDQMIGRHGPGDEGPQLAGSKCASCGQKILSSMEAAACRLCGMPVHLDCRKHHRIDAHREKSGAAYR